MARTRGSIAFLFLVVVAIALLPLLTQSSRGVAPTPAMFSEGLTLAEAERLGAEQGRVTLVFATADWCGPCQAFKRHALVDPDVAAWVGQNAAPALLDLTAPGPEAKAHAQRLGVGAIPAVILLRGGEEIARREGNVPSEQLLRWLERSGSDGGG